MKFTLPLLWVQRSLLTNQWVSNIKEGELPATANAEIHVPVFLNISQLFVNNSLPSSTTPPLIVSLIKCSTIPGSRYTKWLIYLRISSRTTIFENLVVSKHLWVSIISKYITFRSNMFIVIHIDLMFWKRKINLSLLLHKKNTAFDLVDVWRTLWGQCSGGSLLGRFWLTPRHVCLTKPNSPDQKTHRRPFHSQYYILKIDNTLGEPNFTYL